MQEGVDGLLRDKTRKPGKPPLPAAVVQRVIDLNVLDGTVIGRNMQRHRHQEFVRFLNQVEAAVPAGKTVHAIVDN